jgi:hypothetical protein
MSNFAQKILRCAVYDINISHLLPCSQLCVRLPKGAENLCQLQRYRTWHSQSVEHGSPGIRNVFTSQLWCVNGIEANLLLSSTSPIKDEIW